MDLNCGRRLCRSTDEQVVDEESPPLQIIRSEQEYLEMESEVDYSDEEITLLQNTNGPSLSTSGLGSNTLLPVRQDELKDKSTLHSKNMMVATAASMFVAVFLIGSAFFGRHSNLEAHTAMLEEDLLDYY